MTMKHKVRSYTAFIFSSQKDSDSDLKIRPKNDSVSHSRRTLKAVEE